jgi:hypothetical protein
MFSENTKKAKGKIKFIDKNTLLIGDNTLFKRTNEGLKSEDEYLKFFNERKTAWKKNHGKD